MKVALAGSLPLLEQASTYDPFMLLVQYTKHVLKVQWLC